MTALPDLPKKYNRAEAKVDDLVMDWFLKHYPDDVLVEVKVGKNKLLPHQDATLNKVKEGVFKYKFPDMGRRTPGDFIVLKKAKAFEVRCNGRNCKAVCRDGESFTFKV